MHYVLESTFVRIFLFSDLTLQEAGDSHLHYFVQIVSAIFVFV